MTTAADDPSGEGADHEAGLTRSDVADRASRGAMLISVLGFTGLAVGFLGSLALARFLTPTEFGVLAVGQTILLFSAAVGEAGLGVAMVRWQTAPTRRQLQELSGLQLWTTLLVAGAVALVALQFGRIGSVTALMIASLPLVALQTPGRIQFERSLRYGPITVADGAGLIAFYAWAIGLVALDAGVWGVASAPLVRGAVGTAVIAVSAPGGLVRPVFVDPRSLWPLISFGLRFQGNWVAILARDLVINAITGSLLGVARLGIWSLARRLLEAPQVFSNSLWRVTFPAMSRLIAGGGAHDPFVRRSSRFASAVFAMPLSAFAGLAPAAIPTLFGEEWSGVGEILPLAAAALLISTSTNSGPPGGYLMAIGRPQDTLVAVLAQAAVWIGVTAVLLRPVGVVAIGIGWVAGACVEAAVIERAVRRACGVSVGACVLAPVVAGLAGIGIGVVVDSRLGAGLTTSLVAGGAGVATTGTLLILLARATVMDVLQVIRHRLLRRT
ncbi:MAG: oligosaccharide flippase family protein [Gaiella sp.]